MTRENDIRKEILMQLYAVRPLSLRAARIARDARKADYDYSEKEISRELQFLEDSALVIADRDPGTTGKVYRLSPAGITHYEEKFA
jgi:DNA-binding transcriptional ArsR family regulator